MLRADDYLTRSIPPQIRTYHLLMSQLVCLINEDT